MYACVYTYVHTYIRMYIRTYEYALAHEYIYIFI